MSIRTDIKPGGTGLFTATEKRTKLIVGLGNVGDEYAKTRHNFGFMAVDCFQDLNELPGFKDKSKVFAEVSEGVIAEHKVIVVKPTTLMNLSGKAVFALMEYFEIVNDDVVVVHDELDIPFGTIRSRFGGGSAGHNGVDSIAKAIGEDFYRIKLGIGSDHPQRANDTSKFVLSSFSKEESAKLPALLEQAADLIKQFVTEEIQDTTVTS